LHGARPWRHYVRESRRIWIWGLALPLLVLAAAWTTKGLSLLLLAAYVLPYWRTFRGGQRRGWRQVDAHTYALFCTIGKLPEAIGQIRYWWNRFQGRASRIIEYKVAEQPPLPAPPARAVIHDRLAS
jgi:hypothetical protein